MKPINLLVKCNATHPTYRVDVSWDELYIGYIKSTSGSFTFDITASGALGLDTGAEASSTWYYIWALAKTDGTVTITGSINSTTPTLPSGYTIYRLISMVRNDSGSNFVDFVQQNEIWAYVATTNMKAGAALYDETLDCRQWIPEKVKNVNISYVVSTYHASAAASVQGYLYSYLNGVYVPQSTAINYVDVYYCYVYITAGIQSSSRYVKHKATDLAGTSALSYTALTLNYFEVLL